MSKLDLIDITCEIRARSDKAFGLWEGELTKDGEAVLAWVPKSQCEENDDGTVTMPEWLAYEKGLI